MPQDISKFIAFAAAHPKLLGRSSLFGAVNEDHTAFKLFVEYIKQQKLIYHAIPNNVGIAEFKAYITAQDATKYQEILDKMDNLHRLGFLRDQLGSRDLSDLALIFDELGLDAIDPRFAESKYNQFLLDSYNAPVSQLSATEVVSESVGKGQKSGSTTATSGGKPVEKVSAQSEKVEAVTSEGGYADSTGSPAFGSELNVSAMVKGASASAQAVPQALPQAVSPSTPQAKSTTPQSLQPGLQPKTQPELAVVAEDQRKKIAPIEELSVPKTEPKSEETPESSVTAPESSSGSVPITAPAFNAAPAAKVRGFKRPVAAKDSQNIRYLDTVSGLRQRAQNKPNFAQTQEEEAQSENETQDQQQSYAQRDNQQARARSRVKTSSPGKKLLGRVFASIAGVGGALAMIPNPSASAAVIKRAIAVVLFSLIIAVNVPLFTDVIQPDHFTAYAADPVAPAAPPAGQPAAPPAGGQAAAPAPGVPAAPCPPNFTADGPTKCFKDGAAAADKCIEPFSYEESRVNNKLVCIQAPAESQAANQALENMTGVIVGIQKFLNTIIWPVLVMIGGLMDNSLLFGSGMEERLRDIWIPMRNLVNILFVIVLVGVALYNVLGIGEEGGSYSIKSMLPKIIVGILAVNFSFLGIKVVLDATNAITTSIFALPADANIGLNKVLDPTSVDGQRVMEKLCANIQGKSPKELAAIAPEQRDAEFTQNAYREVANKYFPGEISKSTTVAEIDQKFQGDKGMDKQGNVVVTKNQFDKEISDRTAKKMCIGTNLTPAGIDYLSEWNSHSAALAMALNMGGIVFYNDVKIDVNNIDKLFINALFSTIMYIIYVASFISLFIILLGRLLVMWVCVAMSPILVLVMFSPELKDKVGGFGKLEEQFTKNAIAPIIIAISMTVGWIMLNALKGLNTISTAGSVSLYDVIPNNGVPVAGLDTLGDFVVALGTIGVVWLGVFSAAEGTIAEGAVNMIKGGLESAGKFIATTPLKHLNIVPIKLPGQAEENYSLGELGTAVQRLAEGRPTNRLADKLTNDSFSPETFLNESEVKDYKDFGRGLNKAKGTSMVKDAKFSDMLKNLKKRRGDIYEKLSSKTRDAINAFVSAEDKDKIKAFQDILDSRDIDGNQIKSYGSDLDTSIKKPSKPSKPSAPSTPATPPTPPGPVEPAPAATMSDAQVSDLTIGGKKVSQQLSDGNLQAQDNIPPIKAAAKAVADELAQVANPEAAGPEQKAGISGSFKDMHIGENGAYPSAAELPAIIGQKNADKIFKIYGGEEGYATMIHNIEESTRKKTDEEIEAEEALKR